MPVTGYGFWKATPTRYTYETAAQDPVSPHLTLYFTDNRAGEGQAAINIRSTGTDSRLAYWYVSPLEHPITAKLGQVGLGYHTSDQSAGGTAIDYIRSNLFEPQSGQILPPDGTGAVTDFLDVLRPVIDQAIQSKATVYIFGTQYSSGKGIHNVHQNQGNSGRFLKDNGVFQDGGMLFQFADHWEGVFIGFASQAIHTNDTTGDPLPATGYVTYAQLMLPETPQPDRDGTIIANSPVRITSALVNPRGKDNEPNPETVTITNITTTSIDLIGWKIYNTHDAAQDLSGSIAPKSSITVKVPKAPLSNNGGIITLLNAAGLKVDGVSYAKAEAKRDGVEITFRS